MDEAFNQHSQHRRRNRSSTNLHHLSLAPLTSKFPLTDEDCIPDDLRSEHHHTPGTNTSLLTPHYHHQAHSTSYLHRKSAPTTPRLISRTPGPAPRSRSHARGLSTPGSLLPKSKSATNLDPSNKDKFRRTSRSGYATPSNVGRKKRDNGDDGGLFGANDRVDSDWLLRAGALISAETRESKGQAWLVSRESSTSLVGMRDADQEAFEMELARERLIASRRASRRNSSNISVDSSSPRQSRRASRSHSRVGSRTQLHNQAKDGGYFASAIDEDDSITGPDFVNLDEKLEAIEHDTTEADELAIRNLVRSGNNGSAAWMGSFFGWRLFNVSENEEEEDNDDEEEEELEVEELEDLTRLNRSSARRFEGVPNVPEERMPPPKADEGGWKDAAWLLTVASKVIL